MVVVLFARRKGMRPTNALKRNLEIRPRNDTVEAQQILNDPNVWIGDTGATVHVTPHKNGITNVRKGCKKDAVTVGNK
jgi:hypothetical protein